MIRCSLFSFCSLPDGHQDECGLDMQHGFQRAFTSTPAMLAIGGGAVGAGKSAALLIEALRHIDVPGFSALILRKKQQDLDQADGLWDKSNTLYPHFGGERSVKDYKWRFSSGATVQFGFVDPLNFEQQHQGAGPAYLAFDELTHFTKAEFVYIFGRNRSASGIRPYCRATCNPERESWVREIVDPWIGSDGFPDPLMAGRLRYLLGRSGKWFWGESAEELLHRFPNAKRSHIVSATFVPGKLSENLYMGEEYEGKLLMQEEHIVSRFLEGNWNASSEVGKTFKREWFQGKLVDEAPAGTIWVRAWDPAATSEADAVSGTSYTAGPRLGKYEERRNGELISRRFFVGDLRIGRWDAGDGDKQIIAAAQDDGTDVRIWICRERAGAGKSRYQHYVALLAGYSVDGDVESGDKATRTGPFAAQCKAGNVYVVKGPWNEDFFRHLYRLPQRPDDLGDALSAAFDQLTLGEHYTAEDVARQFNADRAAAKEISESFDFSCVGRLGQGRDDEDGGNWGSGW